MKSCSLMISIVLLFVAAVVRAEEPSNARPPQSEAELRSWLENMIWYHQFSLDEIQAATGLPPTQIIAAQQKWDIYPEMKPKEDREGPLVLPYPGGRHPRLGFLEGAIAPQRETKVSVFLPWQPDDYVVVDVPEALWSNLGLTYLAHTHVETIWDKEEVTLPTQEWQRDNAGTYTMKRELPNGITFESKVTPKKDHVAMSITLHNGTAAMLSDLRVQNCVMLRAAEEFNQQDNENKLIHKPYMAVRNIAGDRWIITAWTPCHRPWGNQRCPCLHSDPKFPDCGPGETKVVKGWLSFYEGTEIEQELDRIEATGWSR